MCARRFLMIVVVLTLLVVAGAFAVFQWGGNILLKEATPKGHFEAPKGGGAPAYADSGFWIARHGLKDNPADWLPAGVTADSSAGRAAIFYVHPTTYLDRDRWNAAFSLDAESEFRTRLFVQSQASAFNGAGQIWAPRYRQAAFGAFLLDNADARAALYVAYRDVAAAFEEFVKEAGDRPVILAGHSQGALHLERLLKEKVAGQPIAKRVVAAYVVGWPISTTADLAALGLPACSSQDQARCILSWMTFADPPNPDFIFNEWSKTRGFNGAARRREDTLCVNPISGTQDGAAAPRENPGTLVPAPDLRSATLEPGVVGAHCKDGLLILDGHAPGLGGFVLPGNNYHAYDYALFWGAIRRDATTRLSAWNADQHRH